MKSLRKAYRGEKGFTLVELLVVVVILGVLAAVAVLAVTRFMGQGRLEAAQTELHQAQTAIAAAMSDTGVAVIAGTPPFTFGPGADLDVNGAAAGGSCQSVLHGPLKGTYTVNAAGDITAGTQTAWGAGIVWDTAALQWKKA